MTLAMLATVVTIIPSTGYYSPEIRHSTPHPLATRACQHVVIGDSVGKMYAIEVEQQSGCEVRSVVKGGQQCRTLRKDDRFWPEIEATLEGLDPELPTTIWLQCGTNDERILEIVHEWEPDAAAERTAERFEDLAWAIHTLAPFARVVTTDYDGKCAISYQDVTEIWSEAWIELVSPPFKERDHKDCHYTRLETRKRVNWVLWYAPHAVNGFCIGTESYDPCRWRTRRRPSTFEPYEYGPAPVPNPATP